MVRAGSRRVRKQRPYTSLRGALATKQSRGHSMRGATSPDGHAAAPGLLPATRARGRNDGQEIGSLISGRRLGIVRNTLFSRNYRLRARLRTDSAMPSAGRNHQFCFLKNENHVSVFARCSPTACVGRSAKCSSSSEREISRGPSGGRTRRDWGDASAKGLAVSGRRRRPARPYRAG